MTALQLEEFIDYYVDTQDDSKYLGSEEEEYNAVYLYENPQTLRAETLGFYPSVVLKREFNELRPSARETIVTTKGSKTFLPHQEFMGRFLSPVTPYDRLLAIHEVGTGKSLTYVAAAEEWRKQKGNQFKRVLVLCKRPLTRDNQIEKIGIDSPNQRYAITWTHADEQHERETRLFQMGREKGLSEEQLFNRAKFRRLRAKVQKDYEVITYLQLAKLIQLQRKSSRDKLSAQLAQLYNNTLIVIDEAHNLKTDEFVSSTAEDREERQLALVQEATEAGRRVEEDINVYEQIKFLLDHVQGSKVLLLTATPMRDDYREATNVLNLLLSPATPSITPAQITTLVTSNIESIVNELRTKLRGRISYLRAEQKVQYINRGDLLPGILESRPVVALSMSEEQTTEYKKQLEQDRTTRGVFWQSSINASIGMFPTRVEILESGKTRYIFSSRDDELSKAIHITRTGGGMVKQVEPTALLKSFLTPKGTQQVSLNRLKVLSAKYAFLIHTLQTEGKKAFVYCDRIGGAGVLFLMALMGLFGIRYKVVTGSTGNSEKNTNIINAFNSPENTRGELIQVLIGSEVTGEGLDLRAVRQAFIITPAWNDATIDQVLGRTIRTTSHIMLPPEEQDVEVFRLASIPSSYAKTHVDIVTLPLEPAGYPTNEIEVSQNAAANAAANAHELNYVADIPSESEQETTERPKKRIRYTEGVQPTVWESIDLRMYRDSELKDREIKAVERFLKQIAVDCALNRHRNILPPRFDNLRECDYQSCDYDCYNVPAEFWVNETSTTSPPEQYTTIAGLLQDTFNLYYTDREVHKVTEVIKWLFQSQSSFLLSSLVTRVQALLADDRITEGIVLKALVQLVNDNVPVVNRHGFSNFVRSYMTQFFLVDDPRSSHALTSAYYADHPMPAFDFDQALVIEDEFRKKYQPQLTSVTTIRQACDQFKMMSLAEKSKRLREAYVRSQLHLHTPTGYEGSTQQTTDAMLMSSAHFGSFFSIMAYEGQNYVLDTYDATDLKTKADYKKPYPAYVLLADLETNVNAKWITKDEESVAYVVMQQFNQRVDNLQRSPYKMYVIDINDPCIPPPSDPQMLVFKKVTPTKFVGTSLATIAINVKSERALGGTPAKGFSINVLILDWFIPALCTSFFQQQVPPLIGIVANEQLSAFKLSSSSSPLRELYAALCVIAFDKSFARAAKVSVQDWIDSLARMQQRQDCLQFFQSYRNEEVTTVRESMKHYIDEFRATLPASMQKLAATKKKVAAEDTEKQDDQKDWYNFIFEHLFATFPDDRIADYVLARPRFITFLQSKMQQPTQPLYMASKMLTHVLYGVSSNDNITSVQKLLQIVLVDAPADMTKYTRALKNDGKITLKKEYEQQVLQLPFTLQEGIQEAQRARYGKSLLSIVGELNKAEMCRTLHDWLVSIRQQLVL